MRSLRCVLISLALTLMLLALGAVKAHGVFAAEGPAPPPPPAFLYIDPPVPCAGQPVTLVAVVPRCPPCISSVTWGRIDSTGLRLTVRWFECETLVACPPDTLRYPLGAFEAGSFTLRTQIRGVQLLPGSTPDSVVTDTESYIFFSVAGDCGGVPPIPLRSVVTIGDQVACDSCPPVEVCPERPIRIQIRGAFPSSCGHVRKVEFIPSLLTVIGPPTVRVLLDSEDCFDRPCLAVVTPWVVDTVIPGLPRGSYRLPVEVAQVSCSDSILPGRLVRRLVPFATTATCSTVTEPRCFYTEWGPVPLPTVCNATIAPGSEAVVTLGVRSGVPLAGLQGVLRCDPLQVRNLEAVGPAAGMTLQWIPTPDGARFVMFATHGAPIPAYLSTDPRVDPIHPLPPVLRITVGLPAGGSPPPVMWVRADSLIGADSLARLVPECPDLSMRRPMPPGARVCLVTGCDVNGDGRGDVRDLVLMVHCILGGGPCPDTTAGRFDCDGDGRATLGDILCCARTILRGAPRDTTPPIKEPAVALRFGEAVRGAGGVSLPLTLEGADHVGALRMALRFPSDRYDVAGLTSSAGSGWLALHEVRGDEVVVGLIALAPVAEGATVPLTLALTLKPGQTNGGDVTVTEADLSAPDGAALATDLPGSGTPLVEPTSLSLAIQPNPIGGGPATVRFALPRATHVDVGVFDIAGRRVATLATGALPAGVHTRSWYAQGAQNGVYFVRMSADGVEVAHKAVLRRGR